VSFDEGFHDRIVVGVRKQIDLPRAVGSGYNLARMRHEIVWASAAVEDIKRLRAFERSAVRDAVESWLRHEPAKVSKTRIKRLRGMRKPQYRLRVEEVRVFYDVNERYVEVLAVVFKGDADAWLQQYGEAES
jgi:mRNA interferase RelE/StbE